MRVLGIELSEWQNTDIDTDTYHYLCDQKDMKEAARWYLAVIDSYKQPKNKFQVYFPNDFDHLTPIFESLYTLPIDGTLDEVKSIVDSFLMRMDKLLTFT